MLKVELKDKSEGGLMSAGGQTSCWKVKRLRRPLVFGVVDKRRLMVMLVLKKKKKESGIEEG
jgi:hypothetical protein